MKRTDKPPTAVDKKLAVRALNALVAPPPTRHCVVFGLVAPVGTPTARVETALVRALDHVGYSTHRVHLSSFLKFAPNAEGLAERGDHNYYESRMDHGDEYRSLVGSNAALAARGVLAIAQSRESTEAGRSKSRDSVAFIVRSLKRVEEHELFKRVYGDSYVLIGASSTNKERREHLEEQLSGDPTSVATKAEELLRRDEDDGTRESGQQVRKLFELADAYIPVVRGVQLDREVERVVGSIFGDPFLTPTPAEEGMRIAATASLRSAAMSRQVGAALIPRNGSPVVVGTNEVPKPGGGQYWAGDEPDFRDFQSGTDPNPRFIRELGESMFEGLRDADWLSPDRAALTPAQLWENATQSKSAVLGGSRLVSLIEFSRCVHAEQAAILNAARSGVSTEGAILYSTTFPCHECTKLIVGAGISEVIYIEPYPKSLAATLFRDLIDVEPSSRSSFPSQDRLPFRQYQGIAPRMYERAFKAVIERKVGEAAVALGKSSYPVGTRWDEESVHAREDEVIGAMVILDPIGVALQRGEEPPQLLMDASSPRPAPATQAPSAAGESEAGVV